MTSICQLLSKESRGRSSRGRQKLPPGPWQSWLRTGSHSPVEQLQPMVESRAGDASPHWEQKLKTSHVRALGGLLDRGSRNAQRTHASTHLPSSSHSIFFSLHIRDLGSEFCSQGHFWFQAFIYIHSHE